MPARPRHAATQGADGHAARPPATPVLQPPVHVAARDRAGRLSHRPDMRQLTEMVDWCRDVIGVEASSVVGASHSSAPARCAAERHETRPERLPRDDAGFLAPGAKSAPGPVCPNRLRQLRGAPVARSRGRVARPTSRPASRLPARHRLPRSAAHARVVRRSGPAFRATRPRPPGRQESNSSCTSIDKWAAWC